MSVREMVQKLREETFSRTPQITLGELIQQIKEIDAEDGCWVSFAFGYMVPTDCRSWRGSYREIAIGFKEMASWDERPLLREFLSQLEGCIGEKFWGYKGGEYTMYLDTPVWVANWGDSGNTGVIGVCADYGADNKAYRVYIRTDYCEY